MKMAKRITFALQIVALHAEKQASAWAATEARPIVRKEAGVLRSNSSEALPVGSERGPISPAQTADIDPPDRNAVSTAGEHAGADLFENASSRARDMQSSSDSMANEQVNG